MSAPQPTTSGVPHLTSPLPPAAAEHTTASSDDLRSVSDDGADGVRSLTWVLFGIGCVLLVVMAANLTRLSEWALRYGEIPVFLAFFLVMSLAGRWFWAGIDTVVTGLRNR